MNTLDLKLLELEPELETFRFLRHLSAQSGLPFHQGSHYDWFSARPAFNPNVTFNFRFEENGIETGVSEAIARVDRGEIPPTWIVGPTTRPSDLARHLEENGFETVIHWSGMVLDLNTLETEPAPEGIEVSALESDEHLQGWAEVLLLNLFGGRSEHAADQAAFYRKLLGSEKLRFYAAMERGVVVATALLFLEGEFAGIHCVSTHQDYRNRGIGRAVTLAPLLEGKRRGAKVGILQASSLGARVYSKMGFEEVCRMTLYRYGGAAA